MRELIWRVVVVKKTKKKRFDAGKEARRRARASGLAPPRRASFPTNVNARPGTKRLARKRNVAATFRSPTLAPSQPN